MTEPNILGLVKYVGWTVNGHQVYGIRGMGRNYRHFWFMFDYKTVWQEDDFPWSYVAFTEGEEQRFLKNYRDHIEDYDTGTVIDQKYDPTPLSQVEIDIANILTEEINKAINQDIINLIAKNVRSPDA